MLRATRWGWAGLTAAIGTVLIGVGAFWLSFMSLADLAARSGIAPEQAWIWPLLVDGLIVVSTIAVVALDGRAGAWYPWALLMGGALMSVTANALHAVVAADANVPAVLAAAVAAVPPLVLLASTHLTVVLTRSTQPRNPAPAADADDADELPDPAVEQDAITPVEQLAHEIGRREQAERLRAAQWTNKAIARELGVHPSTVGRWLTLSTDEPHPGDGDEKKENPS